ncbi:MAG TPA: choice-of-anchor Q domain-containing protein, partial [Thermomicrobiaceae bacterium]|nr:choice-of-anchor Q domain-containing protein [Thermomicrobiaceae bacterium]
FSQFQSDVQAISGTDTITFGAGAAHCQLAATGTITLQSGASVTIDGNGLVLAGGTAGAPGGFNLLYVATSASLSLNDTTLEYGAEGILSDGSVVLTNSSITGDGARGIENDSTTEVSVTNSTITGNGGDAIYSNGSASVTSSTISGNGGNGGYGLHVGGAVTLTATILAGNPANCGLQGTLTDGGYNLSTDAYCAFSATGSQSNVTAAQLNLQPLADNGGPTPTIALGPGSIAINAIPLSSGACAVGATTDQRGVSRPQGTGCDVGAYELSPTSVRDVGTTYSPSPQNVTLVAIVSSPTATVNEGTVTFTVTDATNTVVGTATTSGTVSNGQASVSYPLPGGTPAGSYTITAAYHDAAGNFADSSGTATLTISAATTTTTPANATAQDVATSVTLSATVTSPAGTVNEGTVTFTVTDASNTVVGTAVTGNVANGSASASFNPYGLAPGSYTITAAYHDAAGNFADSSGTATLTITTGPPASLTLSPGNTTATVGTTQTETATVQDALGYPVADGTTVSFSVGGITTTSGNATTTNGQASFSYAAILPGTDTLAATAQGGSYPSATATITWVLPASTAWAHLSAANFTTPYVYLGASTTGSGGPAGFLTWQGGVSLLTTHVSALVASGPDATLFGTATVGGQTVEFRIDAVAGIGGTLRLRTSTGYDSGTLHVMTVSVSP